MSSKFLLKTATASIFAISVITSDHAYAEDGASLDCAMWLCMPGSRLDALVVGSNPIGAGCLSPYFNPEDPRRRAVRRNRRSGDFSGLFPF